MRTSIKVGGYAAGPAAVVAGALGVGVAVGPDSRFVTADHDAGHATENRDTSATAGTDEMPGGLHMAQYGYRLIPISTSLSAVTSQPLSFRIIGPDGRPVTAYTPTHDKDLHLIVVRRDLSDFQHVHPQMAADGTWSVPLAVAGAGQYRIFADFQPAARSEPLTLDVDLAAAGSYQPQPLPEPSWTAVVDGYTVTLAGDLVPGTASKLTLTVTKDRTPVTDLQPYLAAYGHLVALRDGELAYLHVHPDGAPGDGRTPPGPDITFYAQVPSIGAYRLILDFQHAGTVRTAAFTAHAADPSTADTPATQSPTPAPSDGHGTDHIHH